MGLGLISHDLKRHRASLASRSSESGNLRNDHNIIGVLNSRTHKELQVCTPSANKNCRRTARMDYRRHHTVLLSFAGATVSAYVLVQIVMLMLEASAKNLICTSDTQDRLNVSTHEGLKPEYLALESLELVHEP